MKKLIFVFFATIFGVSNLFSQEPSVLKPSKYPDGIYTKENTRTRRAIPYTTLREADVMWSKRIWRNIDLKEKINLPLYYPEKPTNERKSLFDVIKEAAVQYGTIDCFDDGTDISFIQELTKTEIEAKFVSWDSLHQTEDINNPGSMIVAPQPNYVTSADITKYQLKEDWFFDRQRSVLDVRIIGIMIMKQKKSETGEVLGGDAPIMSIYFPQSRPVFANNEVYMRHNDAERRTFDDIFWKRMFSSYVVKETNVYDRVIYEYTSGLNALLESERIKSEIFKFEHDMWHF